ncbi:hypothetical protein [Hyphomonas sp. UBA3195]|nr:hypothetical protein [Hyphomonas sp. UBA3195]
MKQLTPMIALSALVLAACGQPDDTRIRDTRPRNPAGRDGLDR